LLAFRAELAGAIAMLSVGTQLGHYRIVAPLGAGGMGEVYRAWDPRLEREVAIKVLPEQFAQDVERVARFDREARAVAALAHPNILAIHDCGTAHGRSFAVMELLEGEPLRSRLRKAPLPWRKALEMGVAIAEGLAAAHAKGIIHRDLKPENLFLTADGRVKILDAVARNEPALRRTSWPASGPGRMRRGCSKRRRLRRLSPAAVRGSTADLVALVGGPTTTDRDGRQTGWRARSGMDPRRALAYT
jgi:serine/threonine protein kinase